MATGPRQLAIASAVAIAVTIVVAAIGWGGGPAVLLGLAAGAGAYAYQRRSTTASVPWSMETPFGSMMSERIRTKPKARLQQLRERVGAFPRSARGESATQSLFDYCVEFVGDEQYLQGYELGVTPTDMYPVVEECIETVQGHSKANDVESYVVSLAALLFDIASDGGGSTPDPREKWRQEVLRASSGADPHELTNSGRALVARLREESEDDQPRARPASSEPPSLVVLQAAQVEAVGLQSQVETGDDVASIDDVGSMTEERYAEGDYGVAYFLSVFGAPELESLMRPDDIAVFTPGLDFIRRTIRIHISSLSIVGAGHMVAHPAAVRDDDRCAECWAPLVEHSAIYLERARASVTPASVADQYGLTLGEMHAMVGDLVELATLTSRLAVLGPHGGLEEPVVRVLQHHQSVVHTAGHVDVALTPDQTQWSHEVRQFYRSEFP